MHQYVQALLLALMCWTQAAHSQNVLPLGQWRALLPYQYGQSVAQSEDEVFFAANVSILVMDKEERSTRFITRVNGLSGSDLKLIRYVPASKTLLVVYRSGVLDLVRDAGGILTLPQIRNFTNISGIRSVNDAWVADNGEVYLAASYGLSKLDVANGRFLFTTFTGIPVHRVVEFGGHIYAATEEGVYRTPTSTAVPDDFTNWTLLDSQEGFPDFYATHTMGIFRDQLYFDIDHVLHRMEGGVPVPMHTEPGYDIRYLSAEGRHLLAGYRCASGGCPSGGKMLYFNEEHQGQEVPVGCLGVPNYAVEDTQGRVWFGDDFMFFRVLNNLSDPACEYISINGPYFEKSWKISVHDDKIWVAAGGLDQTRSYSFNGNGFFSFIDGQWTTYNRFTRIEMRGENPDDTTPQGRGDDLFDILNVVVSPDGSKVYAGSYIEGIMEVDVATDQLTLFNANNTPLQRANGDPTRTRIGGLTFDQEGSLWVANHSANEGKPLIRRTKDGEWRAFGSQCTRTGVFDIVVDASGFKWVAVQDGGLLIFDEGNPDDPSDDRCRSVLSTNSNLPSNDVRALAVDRDGDVWVGTTTGVAIFQCGNAAFNPEACVGNLPFVERDGFGANLLSTETVNAIAVDGANRKWVGTLNGVYLLSPNGRDELARFTTDNSPLPDNIIRGITINSRTGEVLFATDLGIVGYQGDAVSGNVVNNTKIEVFPNPVRPEYQGPIVIRGLARDATVKITDVSGRLVYETTALGGQAVWDGTDYNGRRANTGVYLVFSTSNARFASIDDPSVAIAKIMLVN